MVYFRCEYSMFSMALYLLFWIILVIITFGLALMVMPYYWEKKLMDNTYGYDRHGQQVGRMYSDFELKDMIVHLIIWFLLVVCTAGLAYVFYYFAVRRIIINHSQLLVD